MKKINLRYKCEVAKLGTPATGNFLLGRERETEIKKNIFSEREKERDWYIYIYIEREREGEGERERKTKRDLIIKIMGRPRLNFLSALLTRWKGTSDFTLSVNIGSSGTM